MACQQFFSDFTNLIGSYKMSNILDIMHTDTGISIKVVSDDSVQYECKKNDRDIIVLHNK